MHGLYCSEPKPKKGGRKKKDPEPEKGDSQRLSQAALLLVLHLELCSCHTAPARATYPCSCRAEIYMEALRPQRLKDGFTMLCWNVMSMNTVLKKVRPKLVVEEGPARHAC